MFCPELAAFSFLVKCFNFYLDDIFSRRILRPTNRSEEAMEIIPRREAEDIEAAERQRKPHYQDEEFLMRGRLD